MQLFCGVSLIAIVYLSGLQMNFDFNIQLPGEKCNANFCFTAVILGFLNLQTAASWKSLCQVEFILPSSWAPLSRWDFFLHSSFSKCNVLLSASGGECSISYINWFKFENTAMIHKEKAKAANEMLGRNLGNYLVRAMWCELIITSSVGSCWKPYVWIQLLRNTSARAGVWEGGKESEERASPAVITCRQTQNQPQFLTSGLLNQRFSGLVCIFLYKRCSYYGLCNKLSEVNVSL